MHYYTFNINDYAASTQHLDEMEDLAYRRMLDLYYQRETPLPSDVQQIARLIRMRSHVASIENVLLDFFVLDADGYRNEQADENLKAIYERSEKAKKSADARWAKKKKKDEALKAQCSKDANASTENANALKNNANASTEQSECNATQYPIPNTQYTEEIKTMSSQHDPVFEIFSYWKKVMKKSTQTAMSKKRVDAIKKRLKDGYSVDEIKLAIFNCSNTSHNMGINDRNTKYDDVELICRHPESLERFRDNPGNMENGSLRQEANRPVQSMGSAAQQTLENLKDGF
ncbi:hypothetical protein PODOV084v1_p0029 [Vibrio phage 340E47.2]|nr:hypothetical protein PODOV084v1_p0029 [Vibrio phage 340E47.2]QZI91934.1 hypothetical protein PODOV077v1_p0023 [Vibrio phage 5P1a]